MIERFAMGGSGDPGRLHGERWGFMVGAKGLRVPRRLAAAVSGHGGGRVRWEP